MSRKNSRGGLPELLRNLPYGRSNLETLTQPIKTSAGGSDTSVIHVCLRLDTHKLSRLMFNRVTVTIHSQSIHHHEQCSFDANEMVYS